MSFYKIINPLHTIISNPRNIFNSTKNIRIPQVASQFKLLQRQQQQQHQQQQVFFHCSPKLKSINHIINQEKFPYCASHSTPQPTHLQKVHDETIENLKGESQMMITQIQGAFLTNLSKLMKAKKVLEIGCLTGYSALCFAEGVKENGTDVKVISCENDPEYAKIAMQNVKEAGMKDLVEIKVGDARETLQNFDGSTQFDIIFIDANKSGYIHYYDTILERNLLAEKGVIVADNVLFRGYVGSNNLDSNETDRYREIAEHLHKFNEYVTKDPRTTNLLIPAFDGLMLIRRN